MFITGETSLLLLESLSSGWHQMKCRAVAQIKFGKGDGKIFKEEC